MAILEILAVESHFHHIYPPQSFSETTRQSVCIGEVYVGFLLLQEAKDHWYELHGSIRGHSGSTSRIKDSSPPVHGVTVSDRPVLEI